MVTSKFNFAPGNLPEEFIWAQNKTAATILFVKDAERLLAENALVEEKLIQLRHLVSQAKSGKIVFNDFSALEAVIRGEEPHYLIKC